MNSIYYHEDDHGMKLLIPEENLPYIWYEFEEIIGYDIEQKVDTNATEIFSLSNLKIKLIERKITVATFEALCQSLGFERIDEIHTGYSTYRELDKTSKAFGLFDKQNEYRFFTIFYETQDSYISLLWVLDYSYRHDSVIKLLNELGKKWEMCLAENGGKVLNLREVSILKKYLSQ
jgi:hypothetical protein